MLRCSRSRFMALAIGAILSLASVAHATTMRTANVIDLIDLAESIVVGEVVSIEDGFDANGLPYSDITVQVIEDFTSDRTGLRTIRQFGLQAPRQMADGRTALSTTPPGFPRFVTDEKVILFIYQASPTTGMQTTVGLIQGKFTIDENGFVSNAVDNTNLFWNVAAQTDRMPATMQKMVSTTGAIKADDFQAFVRSAVDQRWVEEGVLYHEQ